MATPNQVRQRSAEVDEYFAQQAQPEQPEGENPEAGAQSEEVEQQEPEQEPEQQPEQEQPEAAELEVQAPDDVARQLADMREQLSTADQRFKTLQGMIRSRDEENQRLQTLLAQLSENAQPREEPQSQPESDPGEDRDRQEFGADFVDMVNRAIDRRLSKLEDRLGKTEGMAQQSYDTASKGQQERFEERLTKLVPHWRDIDSSQEFLDWLNESETRVAIVRQGMANYDAKAIAEVFQQYELLTGKGPATQGDTAETKQTTKEQAPAGRNLESKVAPSKGRASKPNDTPEKREWTRSEIAQVFRDRRQHSKKEFEKLQSEIFAAQKEGRVDYTR